MSHDPARHVTDSRELQLDDASRRASEAPESGDCELVDSLRVAWGVNPSTQDQTALRW